MIVYHMFRKEPRKTSVIGSESYEHPWQRVADVVVLDSGKCVVAWPTSVIVYDSEEAARAVHITHMGGRGSATEFRVVWSDIPDFMRGVENAGLDSMENAPWGVFGGYEVAEGRAPLDVPKWDSLTNPDGFLRGYEAQARTIFGDRVDRTTGRVRRDDGTPEAGRESDGD